MWVQRRYDGNKYVCFDDILDSNQPCLIYSFGINDDISFEKTMMAFSESMVDILGKKPYIYALFQIAQSTRTIQLSQWK